MINPAILLAIAAHLSACSRLAVPRNRDRKITLGRYDMIS